MKVAVSQAKSCRSSTGDWRPVGSGSLAGKQAGSIWLIWRLCGRAA